MTTPLACYGRHRARNENQVPDPGRQGPRETRKVDGVLADKTGTLTEGKPKLTSIVSLNGTNQGTVLQLTASLEQPSETPAGSRNHKGYARTRDRSLPAAEFSSTAGKGIVGTVSGRIVAAANEAPPQKFSIDSHYIKDKADSLRRGRDRYAHQN